MGRPIRVDDFIQAARDDMTIPATPQTNESTTPERDNQQEQQQPTEAEESTASESETEDQRQKGRGSSSFGRRYRAVQFSGNPLSSNLSSVLFCECNTATEGQLVTHEEAITNTEGIANSRTAEIEAWRQ